MTSFHASYVPVRVFTKICILMGCRTMCVGLVYIDEWTEALNLNMVDGLAMQEREWWVVCGQHGLYCLQFAVTCYLLFLLYFIIEKKWKRGREGAIPVHVQARTPFKMSWIMIDYEEGTKCHKTILHTCSYYTASINTIFSLTNLLFVLLFVPLFSLVLFPPFLFTCCFHQPPTSTTKHTQIHTTIASF